MDEPLANDLEITIESDSDLSRQQHNPIIKNLATKKARGVYQHDLAVKLFMYLVESGAKKYVKENVAGSTPWFKFFNMTTRRHVAESLTKSFEMEYNHGNYDNLLPKKYRKVSGHERN